MFALSRVGLVTGFALAVVLAGVLVSYAMEQARSEPIPFRTVLQGSGGSEDIIGLGQVNFQVNDNSTWANLWQEAVCLHGPSCPVLPKVNFTSETLLAIFSGVKPTAGYVYNITQVSLDGSYIVVHATLTTPSQSSCVVNEALTNPFQIVAVSKTTATIKLETQNVVRNC